MDRYRRPAALVVAFVLLAGVNAARAEDGAPTVEPRDPLLGPASVGLSTTPDGVAVDLQSPSGETVRLEVGEDPDNGGPSIEARLTGACDPTDQRRCLLPFPNDLFTVADPTTDTGRRVAFDLFAMPRNVAGKPIDPTEWNRNDGFSPGTSVLALVPGLDLHRTWDSPLDNIQDLSWYGRPDAPVVVLDAATGRRHPVWTELDTHPATSDAERLLIVRPAINFTEGGHYVVALRDLRDGAGGVIPSSPAFAAYRDGTAEPGSRTAEMEGIFDTLAGAGIARDDLYLAWDFTVASERNLTERVLSIRDDAFARLGDTDLADGVVAGAPPAFTITSVEEPASGATLRHIEGTMTVPNYLSLQLEAGITGELETLTNQVLDAVPEIEDAVGELGLPLGLGDVVGTSFSVPGSRFNTIGSADGLPVVNPLQPTVDVPFLCNIARTSLDQPSDPLLYGHGLLGSRGEANGGSTQALRERGFTPCAVDWWGMSTSDLPNVLLLLLDSSNFGSLADRSQQGFLNFLYLGRALAHPQGLASHPAFQGGDGQALFRPEALVYDGNSQGAIMGGALTALAPDLTRSVLGVAGMNYSTLLNRSVDWEGSYGAIFYAAYPDSIDQQLTFALMQMLWDRAESNGYAHHMSDDPLPGTPAHEVMLQLGFADHQVANITAEVEGRTIGARLVSPSAPPGLHWSVDPTFGFETVDGDTPDVGSVLVNWFSDGTGLHTPPNGNRPMADGDDPHEAPRRHGPAVDMAAHWLRTGDLIDTCGPGACIIPARE